MSWSASFVFRAAALDMLGTRGLTLTSHALKLALFNNSVTPDKDAAAASTAYNTGTWLTANEIYQVGQWAQAGVAISGLALTTPSSGVVMLGATNPTSGTNCTISGAYGGLVYDSTVTTPVANQGVSAHNFNASTGVTSGTYTAVIAAGGILRATV